MVDLGHILSLGRIAVLMLAVAGLAAEGTTTVATAQAAAVTFPAFADLMQSIGARLAVLP